MEIRKKAKILLIKSGFLGVDMSSYCPSTPSPTRFRYPVSVGVPPTAAPFRAWRGSVD